MNNKCEACGTYTIAIEGHHVVPLNYGGKDKGLKIDICGNCHTTIHQCIEDESIPVPPHLLKYVLVGRRAKERFAMGELAARDRRPTTVVNTNSAEVQSDLIIVSKIFNTKSRAATLLAALHFAAIHGRRVPK